MPAACFEEQAGETRSDFGFDPLFVDFLHSTAKLGDFIETSEFEAFERAV
jgi:hypothetical protein